MNQWPVGIAAQGGTGKTWMNVGCGIFRNGRSLIPSASLGVHLHRFEHHLQRRDAFCRSLVGNLPRPDVRRAGLATGTIAPTAARHAFGFLRLKSNPWPWFLSYRHKLPMDTLST